MEKRCTNKRCYVRKKNGKLEKWSQYEISKQRKRPFKMYMKTSVYVTQNN